MLTQSRLKELVTYSPEMGQFVWAVDRRKVKAGAIAGSYQNAGYSQVKVDYKRYLSHRLAWLYMTGEWPSAEVDHIDGDKRNNKWMNLRAATVSQNRRNAKLRGDNSCGLKGVRFCKQTGYLNAVGTVEKDGKFFTKSFSVKKYGLIEATYLAARSISMLRKEMHADFACDGRRSSQT